MTRCSLSAAAIVGLLALAGCNAHHDASQPAVTTTTPVPSTSAIQPSASSPSPTPSGPQNLLVTDDVRAQLVVAGAAMNSLSPADYVGLVPGETFYAYDPTLKTYWAGAALQPSTSSMQAQVASQDDGSYVLFNKVAGGTWIARPVGLTGTAEGAPCPLTVPAGILKLWGWPAGSCRAPNG
jgi:hypothetical protein